MGYYCTMVHGPCRHGNCDFWARQKLKKATIEDLISGFSTRVKECDDGVSLNQALEKYWIDFGIKNRTLLCREEPVLCDKMQEVERQITL